MADQDTNAPSMQYIAGPQDGPPQDGQPGVNGDSSNLAAVINAPVAQPTLAPQTPAQNPPASQGSPDDLSEYQGATGSRLGRMLAAVASAVLPGIAGAANQRGRASFAGGMAGGAEAELQYKFQTAADAARAAQLSVQERELQNQTAEYQDKHDAFQMSLADHIKDTTGIGYTYIPNDEGGQSVLANWKGQMAQQGSVKIPAGTIPMSHGWLVPNADDATTKQADTKDYNTFAPFFGLPKVTNGAVSDSAYQLLSNLRAGRSKDGTALTSAQLDSQIGNLKYQMKQYTDPQANPNFDPKAAQILQNSLDHMQAIRDEMTKGAASDAQLKARGEQLGKDQQEAADSPVMSQVKANQAAATARAEMPFKQAQARFEQTLKDGDADSAGKMLANGDIAPSQIISTRNASFAQQAFASAKKYNSTFDAQKAEADFKIASSSTNVQFFGNTNSLLDQGGTLDQLTNAYKQLPNGQVPKLNSLKNAIAKAAGSGPQAAYAASVLGVADDYAKVMGGGTGSDTSREQVIQMLDKSQSPDQFQNTTASVRNAVTSQRDSRIGRNPVMQRMYGNVGSNANPSPTQQQQTQQARVIPAGATPGRDAKGNIIGYKTADGKVVSF